MKKIFFLLPAISIVLSGCETAEGFGRDLKKAGAAIERKASHENDDVSHPPKSKKTHYRDR